jgi:hypothetical protein
VAVTLDSLYCTSAGNNVTDETADKWVTEFFSSTGFPAPSGEKHSKRYVFFFFFESSSQEVH